MPVPSPHEESFVFTAHMIALPTLWSSSVSVVLCLSPDGSPYLHFVSFWKPYAPNFIFIFILLVYVLAALCQSCIELVIDWSSILRFNQFSPKKQKNGRLRTNFTLCTSVCLICYHSSFWRTWFTYWIPIASISIEKRNRILGCIFHMGRWFGILNKQTLNSLRFVTKEKNWR